MPLSSALLPKVAIVHSPPFEIRGWTHSVGSRDEEEDRTHVEGRSDGDAVPKTATPSPRTYKTLPFLSFKFSSPSPLLFSLHPHSIAGTSYMLSSSVMLGITTEIDLNNNPSITFNLTSLADFLLLTLDLPHILQNK